MANTTPEILTINGVVLNTYAKNIESLTGRLVSPPKRTGNITVPGRNGTVRTKFKKYDENVITLPMWLIGADDDGNIPGGSTARREFFKRVDELTRLFGGEDLDIRHTLPDGSIRQCFGDVLDVIDMTTDAFNPTAKFGVSITLSEAFWQDLNIISQSLTANVSPLNFTSFAGSTAPMDDLTIKFTGPWLNPVITFTDGTWLALDLNIAAGATVTVNCATWFVSAPATLTQLRRSSSGGRWASIPPGVISIITAGSNRTTATKLELEGRRKYLVG